MKDTLEQAPRQRVVILDDPDGPWARACAQACDRLVAVMGTAVPRGPIAGTGGWNGFEIVGPPALNDELSFCLGQIGS